MYTVSSLLSLVLLAIGQAEALQGGQPIEPEEFPFLASIRTSSVGCLGALLTCDSIITSASCVGRILKSTNDISNANVTIDIANRHVGSDAPTFTVPAASYIIHPEFEEKGHRTHDVAIVYLRKTVPSGMTLVAIGPGSGLRLGTPLTTTGWTELGSTGKKLNLQAISQEECNAEFDPDPIVIGDQSMFCARSGTDEGVCDVDIGGPVLLYSHGEPYLVGINTPSGECNSGHADILTNILYLKPWIIENAKGHVSIAERAVARRQADQC